MLSVRARTSEPRRYPTGRKNAVQDGEIVRLDSAGRSIFKDVPHRRGQPIFYAFDLLFLDDEDLRGLPLVQRKAKLRRLLNGLRPERILYAYCVEAKGIDFFREVCRRDLEGMVAKRRDGAYRVRSTWVKIKNPNYTQAERRREMFDSVRERLRPRPRQAR